ncbi:hypothetical protein K438DRAFT_1868898 [Mycena galopus ATCC 62051]|nr:hypothetical protein K438DRAFT_1868898 [Mycena galopus ATCC 62051]
MTWQRRRWRGAVAMTATALGVALDGHLAFTETAASEGRPARAAGSVLLAWDASLTDVRAVGASDGRRE